MPNEPVSSDEVAAPLAAAAPLTVALSGTTAISGYTWTTPGVNWFYPFLPQQQVGLVISGGVSTISGVAATGWASVNNAGFVFQNGQYNSRREGFGG